MHTRVDTILASIGQVFYHSWKKCCINNRTIDDFTLFLTCFCRFRRRGKRQFSSEQLLRFRRHYFEILRLQRLSLAIYFDIQVDIHRYGLYIDRYSSIDIDIEYSSGVIACFDESFNLRCRWDSRRMKSICTSYKIVLIANDARTTPTNLVSYNTVLLIIIWMSFWLKTVW